MPRFWIIAPIANGDLYDRVWEFDVANNCISIGWRGVGDVSKMRREELQSKVESTYPERAHTLITNMIWNFYHEIQIGDVIVARRGLQILSGVGDVTGKASFIPERDTGIDHPNFLQVSWRDAPRNIKYGCNVFERRSVAETDETNFKLLIQNQEPVLPETEQQAVSESTSVFVLEKYLEEFIISNWGTIFADLEVYVDEKGKEGRQYKTDNIGFIDILAIDKQSRGFVVIELKRDRTSDQVVGQVQRYMGWVKAKLCTNDQSVRGLIICSEEDERLKYAMMMVQGVKVQYYKMSFALSDAPDRPGET
jgi:restriction system protein